MNIASAITIVDKNNNRFHFDANDVVLIEEKTESHNTPNLSYVSGQALAQTQQQAQMAQNQQLHALSGMANQQSIYGGAGSMIHYTPTLTTPSYTYTTQVLTTILIHLKHTKFSVNMDYEDVVAKIQSGKISGRIDDQLESIIESADQR